MFIWSKHALFFPTSAWLHFTSYFHFSDCKLGYAIFSIPYTLADDFWIAFQSNGKVYNKKAENLFGSTIRLFY